jgi:hypothetical protein
MIDNNIYPVSIEEMKEKKKILEDAKNIIKDVEIIVKSVEQDVRKMCNQQIKSMTISDKQHFENIKKIYTRYINKIIGEMIVNSKNECYVLRITHALSLHREKNEPNYSDWDSGMLKTAREEVVEHFSKNNYTFKSHPEHESGVNGYKYILSIE